MREIQWKWYGQYVMNGEGNKSIVFDTNKIIGLLKQYNDFVSLQDHFPDCDLFVSEITEIEMLSFPDITAEEVADINRFLADCVIVPLRPEIKEKTIEFRRVTKCKLPDSIIAATAIVLDAMLATHDVVLSKKQFPGLRIAQ